MMTVHKVAKIAGISVRTLHHYHNIGLLKPAAITPAGYRMYDDKSMEQLQYILLFRELDFPLNDIKKIVNNPNFDSQKALEQQIKLLTMKKEQIEAVINLARQLKKKGIKNMSFDAFDKTKIEKYAKEAKETWGDTPAYTEYEKKNKRKTTEEQQSMADGLMSIMSEFGILKDGKPSQGNVQEEVQKLQSYITQNYYTCTNEILKGLAQMYSAGGEMTQNIDKAGGPGTAVFIAKAIEIYCK